MNRLLQTFVLSICVVLAPCIAACKRHPKIINVPLAGTPTDDDPDLKLSSEIRLERNNSGCEGCDDYALTLRRNAGDIFADATVVRTHLHTNQVQCEGKLSAYYYNHLIQLIKSQGLFEMDDQYAMGWFDSLVVMLSVSVGDRRKTIRTSSEGEVPLKLWGFYMAIDGAVARTKWNDSK